MKKSIYDTIEMQREQLKGDLENVKTAHKTKSEELRKNACAWSMEKILFAKGEIERFTKEKKSIKNKIDKLMPSLFFDFKG